METQMEPSPPVATELDKKFKTSQEKVVMTTPNNDYDLELYSLNDSSLHCNEGDGSDDAVSFGETGWSMTMAVDGVDVVEQPLLSSTNDTANFIMERLRHILLGSYQTNSFWDHNQNGNDDIVGVDLLGPFCIILFVAILLFGVRSSIIVDD
jgi:hypothetical protein